MAPALRPPWYPRGERPERLSRSAALPAAALEPGPATTASHAGARAHTGADTEPVPRARPCSRSRAAADARPRPSARAGRAACRTRRRRRVFRKAEYVSRHSADSGSARSSSPPDAEAAPGQPERFRASGTRCEPGRRTCASGSRAGVVLPPRGERPEPSCGSGLGPRPQWRGRPDTSRQARRRARACSSHDGGSVAAPTVDGPEREIHRHAPNTAGAGRPARGRPPRDG
jgi:hypothetical protein